MTDLPYRLITPLGSSRLGQRWLALDPRDGSTHIVHSCRVQDPSRFLDAAAALRGLTQAHILPVEGFGIDAAGLPWIATPYTGSQDGLLTLEGLRLAKGGRLLPGEVEQVVVQVIGAVRAAHEHGLIHGSMAADELLVDRRGSIHIELYSLALATSAPPSPLPPADLIRDELRSIVALSYQLLTGIEPDEPRIPASRLVRRLDASWDGWFEVGLDPALGFRDAAEAMLPAIAPSEPSPVRVVLGRVRAAFSSS